MSRSYRSVPKPQRGDILIEALFGILLMSIIGLGISYVASRAAVSQRDMKLENIVVSQMRSLLEQNGALLCTTNAALLVVSLPTQTATQPIVATCTTPLAVTVGTSVLTGGAPLSSVVLTTRTQDTSMFGGIIRVGDEP
ncbi:MULTISPECIES: hypothetical protein [Pseudomonas]|jgi:predicted histidine transporter YuiF (NhaC family)|uniref:Type II secretion system protein n=1 Tax=Pseudomonas gingeri TaxID=117681 RepID=A0A7Y7WG56_9PSED|nr:MULTISPECIES: hypothetical protein [Pseudomonas]MCU1737314.1 hypothetical protein [Pseudomonas sp. 20S_6.2_Bac1]NWB48830.1 hypothetical protein [Pseudomonas gingeri]